jgi:hypothetical protein
MTPEQIKEQKEKLQARIDELKSFEGKTFIKKGSDGKTTFVVLKYEGIGTIRNGVQAHLFRVESRNPGSIWTPVASEFLNDYEEVQVTEQTATPEIL